VTQGGVAGSPGSLPLWVTSTARSFLRKTGSRVEQLTARSGGGLIHLVADMQYGRFLESTSPRKARSAPALSTGMSSTANAGSAFSGTSNGAVSPGNADYAV